MRWRESAHGRRTSAVGTNRTNWAGLLMSVDRGRAEVEFRGRQGSACKKVDEAWSIRNQTARVHELSKTEDCRDLCGSGYFNDLVLIGICQGLTVHIKSISLAASVDIAASISSAVWMSNTLASIFNLADAVRMPIDFLLTYDMSVYQCSKTVNIRNDLSLRRSSHCNNAGTQLRSTRPKLVDHLVSERQKRGRYGKAETISSIASSLQRRG